ncbi:uncharacterized protein [Dermacentor andersoni]|uniref:uncharacterized protein n=1 Tax=Dermacentor andersoni TaxID=34620 RepID=UPI003B3B3B7E
MVSFTVRTARCCFAYFGSMVFRCAFRARFAPTATLGAVAKSLTVKATSRVRALNKNVQDCEIFAALTTSRRTVPSPQRCSVGLACILRSARTTGSKTERVPCSLATGRDLRDHIGTSAISEAMSQPSQADPAQFA